ncbi:MAG: response regulator transcription factor [Sulfuriflexus sp.]|nr:response regulator transcription factor [Sulfuriflexus sp.]
MKVLVVDDETLARDRLVSMLQDLDDDYQVVGEAANGLQAIEQVLALQPEVLLLDIHMPGMNGLEVATHLAKHESAPAIIFTTAYDEHALAAFEAQAIAYLLKPIQSEQLATSLKKAQQLRHGQLKEIQTRDESKRSHISVKLRGDLQLIPVASVQYFRADQKYIEMRHSAGISLIEESLKTLEEEFSDSFIRVHRNALIAISAVTGIERDSLGRSYVLLTGCEERLDVSRRHVSAIRQLLKSKG